MRHCPCFPQSVLAIPHSCVECGILTFIYRPRHVVEDVELKNINKIESIGTLRIKFNTWWSYEASTYQIRNIDKIYLIYLKQCKESNISLSLKHCYLALLFPDILTP